MCTKNYQNMLKEIDDKLINNKLKYTNSIIIGDNSSGKSEVLKNILLKKRTGYYLIDSVNRKFDFSKVSGIENIPIESYRNVINSRLEDNIFNLKDTFDLFGDGVSIIEQVYYNYEDRLKSLFKDFFNIEFDIRNVKDKYLGERVELRIGQDIDKISNGYQAILRLFLELIYFKDSVEKNIVAPVIVIDEINEFLSPKNEEKILPFLMKEFGQFRFIVTTHSAEVITSSIDCNILVLGDNECEYLDGNDYTSITDTMGIFEKLYDLDFDKENENTDIELTLRSLLNLKLANNWTDIEEEKLNNIKEDKLSNAHKLLIKQIKSW